MTITKTVTQLRSALDHGTVADVMTKLELLHAMIDNEAAQEKIGDQISILDAVYDDFTEPLQQHHRKTLLALCEWIEDTEKDDKDGTTIISGSIVGSSISGSTVVLGGGSVTKRENRIED